jgi:hypothetical protein
MLVLGKGGDAIETTRQGRESQGARKTVYKVMYLRDNKKGNCPVREEI